MKMPTFHSKHHSYDSEKFHKVMREYKRRELFTHGALVRNPRQAAAIAFSESKK